ncbi:MAG: T9SS type A sorting domain-containing protein, partial [Bacteroidetes bacterium]|nr:T9SS type A sorting domain-containing protein [Bacteroidota bacterium]
GGCVDNALIAGKLLLDGLNNNGIEIIVNYNATNNSYTVSVLNDDIANYNIEWNTNETTATINNVNANSNYTVTLTKTATGCSNSKTFNVAGVTGLKAVANNNSLVVYPNPTSNFLKIETTEKDYTVQVFDIVGNKVLDFNHNFKTNGVINVSSLPKGVYYVVVEGKEKNTVSFIKE